MDIKLFAQHLHQIIGLAGFETCGRKIAKGKKCFGVTLGDATPYHYATEIMRSTLEYFSGEDENDLREFIDELTVQGAKFKKTNGDTVAWYPTLDWTDEFENYDNVDGRNTLEDMVTYINKATIRLYTDRNIEWTCGGEKVFEDEYRVGYKNFVDMMTVYCCYGSSEDILKSNCVSLVPKRYLQSLDKAGIKYTLGEIIEEDERIIKCKGYSED